jgi:hypothetical protein
MRILPNHEKTAGFSPEGTAAIRTELSTILKSSNFSGSKRCQDFLEFIVDQALDGNYEYLTERFLGAELFGRPINYETGTDSIVRVRANDVRRRLAQYYSEGHGKAQVVIELALGNYVPEFHWLAPKATDSASEDASHEAPAMLSGASHHELTATLPAAASGHDARAHLWRVLAGTVSIALILGSCTGWWLREQILDRSLYPLKYEPSMNSLWSAFVNSPTHQTDVVVSDVSFQLIEDIEKQTFTLDDYFNRRYLSQITAQNTGSNLQPVLTLIASKNFGNSSEFRLAQRMTALDRVGSGMHIYNARDYSSALAGQDNMILIGSQYSNPWQQLFEARLNFKENPPGDGPGSVINRSPRKGERANYSPTGTVGYCLVAYLPNPNGGTKALIIEGTSSEATEAGGDFLLSEDELSGFENTLHATGLPYFEVLLETAQVRGTPITASVVAYRIYAAQP